MNRALRKASACPGTLAFLLVTAVRFCSKIRTARRAWGSASRYPVAFCSIRKRVKSLSEILPRRSAILRTAIAPQPCASARAGLLSDQSSPGPKKPKGNLPPVRNSGRPRRFSDDGEATDWKAVPHCRHSVSCVVLSGFALAQTGTPAKPVPAKPAPAKPAPAKAVAVTPAAKSVVVAPAKPAVVQARPAVVTNTNTVPVNATQPARNLTTTAPVNGRPAYTVIQPAGSRAVMAPANSRNAVAVPTAATAPVRPGVPATTAIPATAVTPAGRALPATMVGGTSAAGGVSSYANTQRGAVTMPGTGSFLWGD